MLGSLGKLRVDTYPIRVVRSIWSAWSAFWETPVAASQLGRTRFAVGLIASVIAIESLLFIPRWIGTNGILGTPQFGEFAGDHWSDLLLRPSLLQWHCSAFFVQMYCVALALLSILLMLGIGGRWIAASTFLFYTGLLHRSGYLVGPAEYLLNALLLYLVIDQGKLEKPWQPGIADRTRRWSMGIASKLIQVHVWLWIAFSLLSQLAAVIWWEGEGVWFLSYLPTSFLDKSWLAKRGYWVNLLTHAIVVFQLLAVICLPMKLYRPIGIGAAILSWLLIGLSTGDLYYASAGIVGTFIFWESISSVPLGETSDHHPLDSKRK